MVFLIILIAIQGFLLAWVAQLVAHEEVEVKTGMGVVFAAGLIATIAGFATVSTLGLIPAALLQIGLYFALLTVLLKFAVHLSWKHSTIIGGIYTALYLGLIFLMAFLLTRA